MNPRMNKALPEQGFVSVSFYLSGNRLNANSATTQCTFDFKLDNAVYFSKQGVILAHTDIVAGVVFGTTLANNNVARNGFLTTVELNAQSF